MNLFASASALGSVFQGAAGLVQALKQPKLSSSQFAMLLQQQLEQARPNPAAQQSAADALTQKFMGLRDANVDGKLNLAESGLDPLRFEALDVNKDGALAAQEVRTYATASYQEALKVLR